MYCLVLLNIVPSFNLRDFIKFLLKKFHVGFDPSKIIYYYLMKLYYFISTHNLKYENQFAYCGKTILKHEVLTVLIFKFTNITIWDSFAAF